MPDMFNITLAFTFSFPGSLIFWSRLMSTILCLKGMTLSLFILANITPLNTHSTIMFPIPIVILLFAACTAALGLAPSEKMSNTYASYFTDNQNFMQW